MAIKTVNTRVQMKRDTAANWTTNDPVLLDGEKIAVVTASGETRYKIGDGVKTFSQLPFDDEIIRESIAGKANAADLATVATSGNYNDLADLPTIRDEIYVGTGEMPAGYTLQINPSGDIFQAATMLNIDVTIPASAWSNNTATVSVPGLLDTDRPIADIVQTGNEETDAAIREAWNLITRMVASADSLIAYAEEAPSVDMPLQMKVVR